MGAIKDFFNKLFNIFCFKDSKQKFEEENFEEVKPCFILSPLFPSLETQEIALSVLSQTNKEINFVSDEEEFDEENCSYTLSSIFPSPEVQKEVLDILEKLNKENKEVSS